MQNGERVAPLQASLTIPLLMITVACAISTVRSEEATPVLECASVDVQVVAVDQADALDAFYGARDAFSFFANLGLGPVDPIVVEIVPRLPAHIGSTAVGSYIKQYNRAQLLPYSQFVQNKTWFNIPIDRSLYRSLATHEIAHALADCNFAVPNPTLQAQEYVAYVATFATMDPAVRARVLDATPGEGFDSETKINASIYLVDPMRFAAESYRHYMKQGQGVDFLHAVLAGKALVD